MCIISCQSASQMRSVPAVMALSTCSEGPLTGENNKHTMYHSSVAKREQSVIHS